MIFHIDSIISIENILKQSTFDEREFNKFIKTKATKGFLQHEKVINNRTSIKTIKEEIRKVVLDGDYVDKYGFYLIKRNIAQLNEDIEYIKNNEQLIITKILKEVYKIVPKYMNVGHEIYLYCGGIDGGFTVNREKVFINYGKYIGEREEFIKILSHELYHSRKISIKDRFLFLLKMMLKNNRLTYEIMGKSIEEGMACLVQHGGMLKIDDPIGTLTNRNLVLFKEEFERFNDIILDIISGREDYEKIVKLNIYVIGYHIVSTIYNSEGVLILDEWTVNLKYRGIIKKYIEICNRNDTPSGLIDEVQKWIINQMGIIC